MAPQQPRLFRRSALAFGAFTLAVTSVAGLPAADAAKQSCRNSSVDVTGTAGDDILRIEAQAAQAGGADGFFVVEAGDGNDTVDFTTSALVALKGVKVCLSGGAGDDSLFGTDGKDVLEGGAGNDVLVGYAGNDKLSGGKGKDDLFGGAGRDRITGGSGSDFIYGAEGKDKMYPGAGNDTTVTGPGANLVRNSGGTDLIVAEKYVVTVKGTSTTFKGSSGDNSLTGGKGNDFIFGGKGDDVIVDDKGQNWLLGRAGSDTISGGSGIDTIFGGKGNDTISCGTDAQDWASGGKVNYNPDSKAGDKITSRVPNSGDQVADDCETIFRAKTTFTLIDNKRRSSSNLSPTSASADASTASTDDGRQQLPANRTPSKTFAATR